MKIVEQDGELIAEIRSEDDAWDLLELVRSGELGGRVVMPAFIGWPAAEIVFWRDNEHETLTAPMMEALLDVQAGYYRSIMLIEEGTTSLRSLSEYQRRKYEVPFQIGQGCTKILPDLNEVITSFANVAAANMTGTQITAAIIVFALIIGANSAYRAWLDFKLKKAANDTSSDLVKEALAQVHYANELDVQRWDKMVAVVESAMGTRALIDASEQGRQGVLKAAARVDLTEIAGVTLEPQIAKRMARNARTEPEYEEIRGLFKVTRNDPDYAEGFRVRVQHEGGEEFFATLRDAMIAPKDREIVAEAEWSRGPFWARVSVTRHRGEITSAEIVEVRKPVPAT